MKIGFVSASAAALLALSTTAFAQAPAQATGVKTSEYSELRTESGQEVVFLGEGLVGDANSAYGFEVRPPPRVLRAGLIRPRVNFVPELLKSVENL